MKDGKAGNVTSTGKTAAETNHAYYRYYDGLSRLIASFAGTVTEATNNAGTSENYYYNEADQVLEVRTGTTSGGSKTIDPDPKERTLWDAGYVNAAAVVELAEGA